jgi:hypothetical protein
VVRIGTCDPDGNDRVAVRRPLNSKNDGMSDNSANQPADPHGDAGSLRRMKPAARIVFAMIVVPPILAIGCGLVFVAIDIWREGSRSIARTDWSWWTWPRVLSLLFAAVAIAILVLNRIRLAKRRSDR